MEIYQAIQECKDKYKNSIEKLPNYEKSLFDCSTDLLCCLASGKHEQIVTIYIPKMIMESREIYKEVKKTNSKKAKEFSRNLGFVVSNIAVYYKEQYNAATKNFIKSLLSLIQEALKSVVNSLKNLFARLKQLDAVEISSVAAGSAVVGLPTMSVSAFFVELTEQISNNSDFWSHLKKTVEEVVQLKNAKSNYIDLVEAINRSISTRLELVKGVDYYASILDSETYELLVDREKQKVNRPTRLRTKASFFAISSLILTLLSARYYASNNSDNLNHILTVLVIIFMFMAGCWLKRKLSQKLKVCKYKKSLNTIRRQSRLVSA